MAKTKTPLMSLGASGSIAQELTYQHKDHATVIRSTPFPSNPRSLPQTYQRWLYRDYANWWLTLDSATKLIWEQAARPYHMTGYAWWMKNRLSTLPDIAGGYRFDEPTGSAIADFGKNGNTMAISADYMPNGLIAGCRLFNGLTMLGLIPHHPSLNLITAFTFAISVKSTKSTATQILLAKGPATSALSTPFLISLNYDNTTTCRISDGATCQDLTVTYPCGDSLWHTIHYRMSATQLILSLDGVIVAGPLTRTITPFTNTQDIRVAEASSFYYEGYLDQLVLYNRALDDATIIAQASRHFPL